MLSLISVVELLLPDRTGRPKFGCIFKGQLYRYSRKFTNDDTHISGCNIIRCHLLTINSLAVPHSHYTVLLQYYLDEISHLNHFTLYCTVGSLQMMTHISLAVLYST